MDYTTLDAARIVVTTKVSNICFNPLVALDGLKKYRLSYFRVGAGWIGEIGGWWVKMASFVILYRSGTTMDVVQDQEDNEVKEG